MNKTYTLIFPGRLPCWNDYSNAERRNKFGGAKMKKKIEEDIGLCIMQQLRGVKITKPVTIQYIWFEPDMRRDKDNVESAKKFINDALVRMKVLQGDGWKYIEQATDIGVYLDRKNPRVEVYITETEDAQ